MSVGTENSDDAIAWLIEQANYLLELENPPKVLVGDYPMSEFLVDAALARFVPPNDGAEDLANVCRQVALQFVCAACCKGSRNRVSRGISWSGNLILNMGWKRMPEVLHVIPCQLPLVSSVPLAHPC